MCHSLAANRANAICCSWRSATLPCMRLIARGVANCNYDLADVTLHVINSWCRKLLLARGESRSNSSLPSSPLPSPMESRSNCARTYTLYLLQCFIQILGWRSIFAPFLRYGDWNCEFFLPHSHLTSSLGVKPFAFLDELLSRKLESLGYPSVKISWS